MSVIPVSCLSGSDLAMLGNNLQPAVRKEHREVDAVNRSLAGHGEQVGRLYRRRMPRSIRRSAKRIAA